MIEPVMHHDLLTEIQALRTEVAALREAVDKRARLTLPFIQAACLLLAAGLLILLARIA